jgi:phosphatidylglycerol:prolipoprotein diacylglycerol transferase
MIVSVIAFYLPGGIPIYAYSLLIGLGVIAGLFWISQQRTYRQATIQLNAGLWALSGALIGGRMAYVAVNGSYFQRHWFEAIQVQLGGLAWPGALAGGTIALMLYARLKRQELGILSDAAMPQLGLLAISAWLGCWFGGCVYGPATSAWWGLPALDEWGIIRPRLPLQLLCAVLTVGFFWLLERYASRRSLRPGTLAGLAVLGLCLALLFSSLLRADPTPLWGALRLETWVALCFIVLTLAVLLVLNADILRDGLKFVTSGGKALFASLRDRQQIESE